MAHLVGPRATVYIQLNGLSDPARRLRLGELWKIVQAAGQDISGQPSDSAAVDSGNLEANQSATSDWNELVAGALGLDIDDSVGDLFGSQLVVAATDWNSIADGVVLVRLENSSSLVSLLKPAEVKETMRRGRVMVRRTASGLWIADARNFSALALKAEPGSLFDEAVALLNHSDRPSLGLSEEFQSEVSRVRSGYAALVYFEKPAQASNRVYALLTAPLRALARGTVALYLDGDKVTTEFRSLLSEPRSRANRPAVDGRVQQLLPQGTLLAWSSSFELEHAKRMVSVGGIGFWRRVLGIRSGQFPELDRKLDEWVRQLVEALESRITLVFGPDELSANPSPSFAILLETADPRLLYNTLRDSAVGLGEGARDDGNAESFRPTVRQLSYLGYEICQVSVVDRPSHSGRRSGISSLWDSMELCFCAGENDLILSMHLGQLQQILDARSGVAPSLSRLGPLAGGAAWDSKAVVLAFAQPALASHLLGEWMGTGAGVDGSASVATALANPSTESARERTARRLGIEFKAGEQPGTLAIVNVAHDGPAKGHLLAGDRIVGVQGRHLSLDDPAATVNDILESSNRSDALIVRIERDQTVLDVRLTPDSSAVLPAVRRRSAADSFKRLRGALRPVALAVYRVNPSSADRFEADITLHLISRPDPPMISRPDPPSEISSSESSANAESTDG